MRTLILILAIAVTGRSAALADPQSFYAGITHITVQDVEPFDATVWYPTQVAEVPFKAGPYVISATRDAKIAEGTRFPVILLSHGRRGLPLGHRELAAHLARDGFIVVAPTHVGDSAGQTQPRPQRRILADRPRQARLALDRIFSDQRFSPNIDASKVGAIGFSAGGYTVLALAGARPNFALAEAYCRDHASDSGSCGPAQANPDSCSMNSGDDAGEWASMLDPRLKAIVVMDPLSILFDVTGLAPVRVPVLLLRPENDEYLSSKGNALALAAALPAQPRQIVVSGGHFVFIDPCPPEIMEALPMLCKDQPGVDRAAIHRQIETAISEFLRKAL